MSWKRELVRLGQKQLEEFRKAREGSSERSGGRRMQQLTKALKND